MKRDPYFDVLKFVAILLVVFGHARSLSGCAIGQPFLGNFTVGMNMPLFFVISGYFSARTIESGDWGKLGRHVFGYFWPAAVVSVVFAALSILFHLPDSKYGVIGCAGRNFLFGVWFLWCLAICFVLTFFCARLKRMHFRWGGILFLIIILPCMDGVWHMANVRSMLPHFLIGAFVIRKWELWKVRWVGALCLSLFLVVVFVQGDVRDSGLSFYGAETTWRAFCVDWHNVLLYFARIGNGVIGSIGVMWLLYETMGKVKGLSKLEVFGTTTLWVYILHYWLLTLVFKNGLLPPSFWAASVWTVVLFLFCHGVGSWCQRVSSKVTTRLRKTHAI